MEKIVNTIFFISIGIILIKGSDFLIRPEQQEKIKDFFIRLYGITKTIKPLNWLSIILGKRITLVVTICVCIIFMIVTSILNFDYIKNIFNTFTKSWFYSSVTIVLAINIVYMILENKLSLDFLDFFIENIEPNKPIKTNLKYFAYLLILSVGCMILYGLIMLGEQKTFFIIYNFLIKLPLHIKLVMFIFTTIYSAVFIMVSIVVLVLFAYGLFYLPIFLFFVIQIIFRIILGFLNFIIVRIIEYKNGVVSAITVLLTIVLGIIKIYLEF